MYKICYTCKEEKKLTDFNVRSNGKPHSNCKTCHNEYTKKHYRENKKYYADKRDRNNTIYRERYINYKRKLSCSMCGYSFKDYPSVCDFHHVNDDKEISPSLLSTRSWKVFMKEVSKCIPLCANCHRIVHAER